jgi:hypothetical protein
VPSTAVELTDMTDGEGPQERPTRRPGHHPMPQDQFGLSRSEHVGVIDAITPSDHRVHQRHPLAPRPVVIEDHLEAVEALA